MYTGHIAQCKLHCKNCTTTVAHICSINKMGRLHRMLILKACPYQQILSSKGTETTNGTTSQHHPYQQICWSTRWVNRPDWSFWSPFDISCQNGSRVLYEGRGVESVGEEGSQCPWAIQAPPGSRACQCNVYAPSSDPNPIKHSPTVFPAFAPATELLKIASTKWLDGKVWRALGKASWKLSSFFPESLNHSAAFSPQTFQGPFNGLMLSWSSNIWYLSPGFGEI